MPLTLEAIQQQTRQFAWQYAGETVQITYNPAAMTPRLDREVRDRVGAGEDRSQTVESLLLILLEWDIESKGEPVPIDRDVLAAMPLDFLIGLNLSIWRDYKPGEVPGATSGGGSSAPRRPAMRSLTGT